MIEFSGSLNSSKMCTGLMNGCIAVERCVLLFFDWPRWIKSFYCVKNFSVMWQHGSTYNPKYSEFDYLGATANLSAIIPSGAKFYDQFTLMSRT
jgi:hypothetical protein